MKKILSLGLALTMMLSMLAGCSKTLPAKTPEELNKLYTEAITANGGEMVEYNPVTSGAVSKEEAAMWLEMMGMPADGVTAFGITTSMMMVHAFGIVAAMPAEGKTEEVKEALQNFINLKQQAFEHYLPDQYENAKNAKLEVLADGTVLMVMCADQDNVFNGIKTAIEGAY